MAVVIEVDQSKFQEEIIESEQPVLVDFWAPWCGPCRMVAPVLKELAEQYDGRLKVAKVNVDENSDLAARYGVMSVPTLIFFKDGEHLETFVGFQSKADLAGKIEKLI